eukprot:TRINITY_DN28507_c0_g1_i1.p2 TRINITY_DN28507_c0_g1~~TRINITY_DN28507_c0_g1_i1.p2  ORF type:complete len:112 (-),score=11.84 TRINITY_DN28507_c0_g1_i1:69-404(-)
MLRSLVGSEMCIRDSTDIVRVANAICSSMLCAAVRSALLLDEVRTARSVVLLLGCIDRWRVEPVMGSSTASACNTMLAPSALGKGIPKVTVNTSSCTVSYTHLTLPTKRIV